jgi:hypothetical protein
MFEIWYHGECNDIGNWRERLLTSLGPDEHGRTPGPQMITKWREEDAWDQRADARNAKAALALDNSAIKERVEMLKVHAKIGKDLSQKGVDYLRDNDLSTATEAIRAIVEGTNLERQSAGYADFLARITQATDEQLDRELKKFMGSGEVIDAESTDVTDEHQEEPQP